MNFSNQLTVIILILLLQLALSITSILGFQLYEFGGGIFYILSVVLEVAALFFLYSIVVNHFGGRIHLVLILIISISSIYSLIDHFYNFMEEPTLEQTLRERYVEQFLIRGLPNLLAMVCNLVLAYQLLKNNVPNMDTQLNLKLVGKSYFVSLAAIFVIPALLMLFEEFVWIDELAGIIYLLPIFLLLKLYWEELNRVKADNMR